MLCYYLYQPVIEHLGLHQLIQQVGHMTSGCHHIHRRIIFVYWWHLGFKEYTLQNRHHIQSVAFSQVLLNRSVKYTNIKWRSSILLFVYFFAFAWNQYIWSWYYPNDYYVYSYLLLSSDLVVVQHSKMLKEENNWQSVVLLLLPITFTWYILLKNIWGSYFL